MSDVAAARRSEPPSDDLLFLPWGYVSNAPRSADKDGTPFWEGGLSANDVAYQDPVYRRAARVARRLGARRVMDVGCGSGDKLVHRLGPVVPEVIGVDQASGIALASTRFPGPTWVTGDFADPMLWSDLADREPDLVVCADVIEHVDDPAALLEGLHRVIARGGHALISTPDRARLPGAQPLGPPGNERHIREWSADEFALLLESSGLEVESSDHVLPRRYRWTVLEAKKTVWKVLHRKAVPDRRYNMVFLVKAR